MKILGGLLIAIFLLGCGPSKREVELESQLEKTEQKLATAEEKIANVTTELADAQKKEKTQAQKKVELNKEILTLAKQMAAKEYDCAGMFIHDGSFLKRQGYDEDLRQPSMDVADYVDLFKSILDSHPEVENKPSLIKFNEIAQKWANTQKLFMRVIAQQNAILNSDFARSMHDDARKVLKTTLDDRKIGEKKLLDSVEKLLE